MAATWFSGVRQSGIGICGFSWLAGSYTSHLPRQRTGPTGTSKTGLRVNNVHHAFSNTAVTFALCLVQEATVKTGFCHESVQAESLVVEEQEVVGGTEAD